MNEIKIPKHLGIILDGNGRWAQAKGLSRSMGHKEGLKTLEKLIPYIYKQGVSIISIYVFSTENFKRPKDEVDYLMYLFSSKFKHLENICQKNNIRILFSGRKENLSENVLHIEEELMEHTKNNTQGVLNICLNYGGLSEIVDMVKHLTKEEINTLNEQNIYQYLYQDLPPLDLLIRTGGEYRLSNFMLCQMAYAELYFTDVYFPDFNEEEMKKAFDVYQQRNRRFGGLKNETKSN